MLLTKVPYLVLLAVVPLGLSVEYSLIIFFLTVSLLLAKVSPLVLGMILLGACSMLVSGDGVMFCMLMLRCRVSKFCCCV